MGPSSGWLFTFTIIGTSNTQTTSSSYVVVAFSLPPLVAPPVNPACTFCNYLITSKSPANVHYVHYAITPIYECNKYYEIDTLCVPPGTGSEKRLACTQRSKEGQLVYRREAIKVATLQFIAISAINHQRDAVDRADSINTRLAFFFNSCVQW